MAELFKNKTVPYAQVEEYVKFHNKKVASFIEHLNEGDMEVSEIEAKMPKSFFEIHQLLTKILKDNNILESFEEKKGADQLKLTVKAVMKLQSALISQSSMN